MAAILEIGDGRTSALHQKGKSQILFVGHSGLIFGHWIERGRWTGLTQNVTPNTKLRHPPRHTSD